MQALKQSGGLRCSSCRAPRRAAVSVRAFGSSGSSGAFKEGQRVKVTKPVKVFHVPKQPELNLEGMEGTVVKDVTEFKGQHLSANLPYLVEFQLNPADAKSKFKAHMVRIALRSPFCNGYCTC